MSSGILTKKQIQTIEQEIDEINAHAELLDPSDPTDSEQLYYYDQKLSMHLETLRQSHRKARINEIGLAIVPMRLGEDAPS